MKRRSRTGTPLSIESGAESFVEERGRTFVIKQSVDVAGAAGYCSPVNPDMDRMEDLVNRKFDRKERQIKRDMRDEFENRLARDKRQQDETLKSLRRELSNLTKLSAECESLKDMQKMLRKELSDQTEQVMSLNQENVVLKSNSSKIEALTAENKNLKQENDRLKKENMKLEFHISKLNSVIMDKEKEIENMKLLIESQYKRLKLDLTNTRDRFHTEQETIHAGMRRQQLMLTEISHVVKTMSKSSDDELLAVGSTIKPGNRKDRQTVSTVKVKAINMDHKTDMIKSDKAKHRLAPTIKIQGTQSKKRTGTQ